MKQLALCSRGLAVSFDGTPAVKAIRTARDSRRVVTAGAASTTVTDGVAVAPS